MESHRPPIFAEETPPLLERIPDYVVTFALGLAFSALLGTVIWWISDIPAALTIGYAVILYGVVLALAGGATGGGYTNLGMGAIGSLFGGYRTDESYSVEGERLSMDPRERLARGLRPEANSRAFWQVLGGALYMAVGLAIVILGSPPLVP